MNLLQAVFAIALFSNQYGVTCQKCHTVIPHLNEFGQHFLASGDRIPNLSAGPAFPISAKANLVASSERQGDGPDGQGLPKDIVDEIELFTAGTIGNRASYFVEQYAVDGGEHGLLRDAWVNDRLNPWSARIPLYAQAGSFTLPLPVDPETFRETYQGYSLDEQTIGNNPFNFFDPKIGAKVTIGDTLHGVSTQLFAAPGHDRQSGLLTTGIDTMENVTDVIGPVALTYYHYQGTRPDVGSALNHFTRNGYALVFNQNKWTSETVLQSNYDSSYNLVGYQTSAGFTQLRYAFSPRFFALGRYEGTNDLNGFARDGVVEVGYGSSHNSRITLEDVLSTRPLTSNTLNLQFTIGY